jgi:outer membrane protein assembly factor BamB
MTVRRWASLATLLLACGSSRRDSRCEKSEDCKDGEVCIVSVEGEAGVCAVPGYGVTLVAPAAGTKVNASGVDVQVQVQLASPGGLPPSHVRARTQRGMSRTELGVTESCELSLSGQDGAFLTYQGRCLAQTGYTSITALWGEAETSAGALLTNAVLLGVDGISPAFPEGSGTVACASASSCLRDEEIEVSAYVKDDNLKSVEASLDLEGSATTVLLQPTGELIPLGGGQRYAARVQLKDLSLPSFSGTLAVRIVASDVAGNETAADLAPKGVTRMRWARDLRTTGEAHEDPRPPVALTGPAISGSEIVVGKADGKLHFVTSDGAERVNVAISTNYAPSIGSNTVWVGSEDGRLYGLESDGTLLGSCPSSGQVTGSLFTPAVRVTPGEAAYTGGEAAILYEGVPMDSSVSCPSPTTVSPSEAITTSLVASGDVIFAATAATTAAVRRFSPDLQPLGEPVTLPQCSGRITAPPAADSEGEILVACGDPLFGNGRIYRIEVAADGLRPIPLATLDRAPTESIVILPTATGPGDLIVGTNDGKLHRLGPPASGSEWTDVWTRDLGAGVTGALVAKPESDGAGAVVYAVNARGDLYALDASGATVWSTAGDASHLLGTYSLTFPTIAPAQPGTGRLPTLYVGSAEGKLYAVVVDTDLDTSSPWPKSHRDIKNTSNADLPIP